MERSTRIKIKPYLVNAVILMAFAIIFVITYPKAHTGLRIFMSVVIGYLCVANIVALYLRFYGIRYIKHKPKVFVFDGKTYFRTNISNKLIYNAYYGYPCWDFADIKIDKNLVDQIGGFNRYYRTVDGPFTAVVQTESACKAFFVNLLTILGCWFTIFIFKD